MELKEKLTTWAILLAFLALPTIEVYYVLVYGIYLPPLMKAPPLSPPQIAIPLEITNGVITCRVT